MSLKKTSAVDRHIGQRLRLQRINLGMSQEALGERVNLTFQQIQKYEKGVNRVSAARLFEFSLVLNVEISYFYEGIKPPPKKPTGMQESMNVRDFMDFVSSHEGIALNRNFVRIRNKKVRQSIIDMTRAMEKAQPGRPRRR
ncbi:MAG: helix-turn-helix domain-containing protein [Parvibaculales bacterium]